MSYGVLHPSDAFWRRSNQMGVLTSDLGVLVEPRTIRQAFNDTDEAALWPIVGAPREPASTHEMTVVQLRDLYPDGPAALQQHAGQ